jgi:hypothetical protein
MSSILHHMFSMIKHMFSVLYVVLYMPAIQEISENYLLVELVRTVEKDVDND